MSFVHPEEDTYRPQKIGNEDSPTFGKAIDLGLPSGTKWASCNVGATKHEEYGDYYAWGETEEKSYYDYNTYTHCGGSGATCHNIGSDISGTEYDVAHVKWGGNWYMPTFDDIKELFNNCTYEWTTLNDVNGGKFTSNINGNSIFFPASGLYTSGLFVDGEAGDYWSSTQSPDYWDGSYDFLFFSGYFGWSVAHRSGGLSVRPVEKPKANDIPAESEAIDLGLPSGTKWASCNVGASKPEEYGGYYAWGETEEKMEYSQFYYKYCQNAQKGEYVNLGSDISGTKYDVAHQKWGGKWYMPTYEDIDELLDNCSSEWTTLNGVNGKKFTSNINGNSIFLPAAGFSYDGDLRLAGRNGRYLSSTQYNDYDAHAYILDFDSGKARSDYDSRSDGHSVRPVEKPNVNDIPAEAEAIDLGLPSGTKWASFNVDATKPEEYGGFYAWGETKEKQVYNDNAYKYYQNYEYVNIGSDISGTEYDVAHVKWGGKWCMPTYDDFWELRQCCTDEWTSLNGVYGHRFTGYNGNSIFLPAAGLCLDYNLILTGSQGIYWSSTQNSDEPRYAHTFGFNSDETIAYQSDSRYIGYNIRPVVKE